jgi:hypothetical protein
MEPANNMPLRAADLGKPPLSAELIVKRRPGDGAGQAISHAAPGNLSHILQPFAYIDASSDGRLKMNSGILGAWERSNDNAA